VKTNHFSKQQCADTYEFSVVYKVYFLRFYIFVVSQLCISPYLCWFSYIWPTYYTSLKIILFWSYFNLYTAFWAMAIVVNEAW